MLSLSKKAFKKSIMYKFKEHNIPNQLDEMTVKEWEKVNSILSSSEELIDKYFNIFALFGVKEQDWDGINTKQFAEIIIDFNKSTPKKIDPVKEVTIDGYTYEAFDLEDGVPIRDLKFIEKAFKTGITDRISFMMAVIFKRTDLSNTEHYTEAHIKHKTKMFSVQLASLALPYIGVINDELNTVFTNITAPNAEPENETSEPTEESTKNVE
jgi:hypothetical protein